MNPIDFEKDLREEIEEAASNMGFKLAKGKNLWDTVLDYLTVRNKLIEVKQRKVLVCPDLLFTLFNSPLHPKRKEINEIINIAKKGGNLNPFLSKKSLQSNFHDFMRSEWFICHFHLSLEKDKTSQFVKQVNSLLFAYIDDEYVVFLGTDIHRDGVFGNESWLELIHTNFPHVIMKYKSDKTEVYPQVSAAEREIFRDKGYTLFMTKVKDTVYYNPGVGIMSSGHSMNDVRTTDNIHRWLHDIAEQLKEYHDIICAKLNVEIGKATFKIILQDKLFLCEISTSQAVLEFPQRFDLDKLK